MEIEAILKILVTVLTTMGGWEFVKWQLNRRSNQRIAEAHADDEEFNVLKEHIEFLQKQVYDKETRFAEQTNLVRKQNEEIMTLMREKGNLELQLAMKRCEVKNCPKRVPQSGY